MTPRIARARRSPSARVRLKTPPLLFEKTQALLDRIQKKVDGTFLTYWMSTSGSVCDNDVSALHALLEARGRQPRIALLVKSDGGSGMAALRLVHLLRRYASRLTVIAPLNCASAATMLALGADTIQMGPLSYLTAVDTSLEHDLSPLDHTNQLVPVSNDEVDRVIRLWKETVGPQGRRREPVPGALQVPAPPGHRRPRPREQPLPHALPGDPRLPHEGRAQGRADRAPPELLLPRPPVPDHEPRGAAAGPQGPGRPRRISTRSSRS